MDTDRVYSIDREKWPQQSEIFETDIIYTRPPKRRIIIYNCRKSSDLGNEEVARSDESGRLQFSDMIGNCTDV